MSQEHRIALFAVPVCGYAESAAQSGVIVGGGEDGDAAVCAAAKGRGGFIARNVHLVLDRVSRNRMHFRDGQIEFSSPRASTGTARCRWWL